METKMSTGDKARTVYASWIRSLAIVAAALGLAGTILTGNALVDEPQPASAASELDLFALDAELEEYIRSNQ